jgi:glycosyltransferase involved in cell wall biosynthesis
MRVLHIDTGREMRGGQWQVLHLLLGARHEARLAARSGSPLEAGARTAGIEVVSLRDAVLDPRADLLHAHDARAHTIAALSGKPFVVSRRVAFPIKRGVLSRLKYARASRYLAVSGFVRQRLAEAGVDETRIAVVYDGVPPLPRSSRLGPIVAPATADRRKGSALAEEAARLGGFQVHFSTDPVSDLASARLFIYLSEEEGLGSAVLLAMAAGVPVIASRVGGLPEAVVAGVTGMLVDNRPAEVAAAVHSLLDDAGLLERMSEAARARWETHFTAARMIEQTEAVYRECLS